MKRTNAKIVGGVLIVAIILVAVAYAAISNVGLNINGVGNAQAKQENFKVEFIGTPTTSGKGTTTATIDGVDKTKGTIKVIGLTAKGDEAVAKYTVKNLSSDLSADLTAEATVTNQEYFSVACALEKATLKAQEETILTVTVKLLKTPIDETKENLNSDITVTVTAEPKQPGEENGGSSSGGNTSGSNVSKGTYIPIGFKETEGITEDTGYTIEDSTGNQYVWIEVPKTTKVYPTAGLNITDFTDEEYTKIENDLHTYTSDYRNEQYDDALYNKTNSATGESLKWEIGLTAEQYAALKHKMLKSVYQNGGFYVGKYETGAENGMPLSGSLIATYTPVIKKNIYPYVSVTCSQAQDLASNMESGNYTSSLMFGVQWDLMLKYLETKGTAQADLNTNSINWGNYLKSSWTVTNTNARYYQDDNWINEAYGTKKSYSPILLSTGASDTFSKNGIYDLAGNAQEWTLECYEDYNSYCVSRGGNWWDSNSSSASEHNDYEGELRDTTRFGFRVTLY